MQSVATVEEEILRRIQAAGSVFCFLDYDGTLAPIAPTPAEALPVPGMAQLLTELAGASGMQVAVISGRTIESVRHLLDVPGAYYIGVHGIELRRPDGSCDRANGLGLVRSFLPMVKRWIKEELASTPGIVIEDKGAALACHYRLASESDAVRARRTVERIAHVYQRRRLAINVLYGHEVIEIRPAHVTKGTAVSSLLAGSTPTTLPIYIGDDRTDEDAFTLLPEDAITIHVGPPDGSSVARYSLPNPHAVQAFLSAVLRARFTHAKEE